MKYVRQRLSYKEKAANDFEWGRENIDSLEQYAYQDWHFDGYKYHPDSRMEMMIKSYKLYNSQIDQEDIEGVFNPLGIEIGQRKDEIMPYNKAHNKINVLLGELVKRPFNLKAVLATDERAYATEEIENKLIKEYIVAETNKQILINYLKEQQLPEEEFQKKMQEIEAQFADIKNPEQIREYLSNDFLEPREIKANKILSFLIRKEDIIEKKTDSFKHGLLSDEEHCWVGEVNGYPCLRILNPLNVFYHKSPEIKYVQNGDYAGTRMKMSVADVLDLYKNLNQEQVKKLEEKYSYIPANSVDKQMNYNFKHLELAFAQGSVAENVGSYGYTYNDMVDVLHVEWRSQRKVGFVSFIDQDGVEQTELIDEGMKISEKDIPGFIGVTWEWIPEIWEGTKIDNDIYVDIRPVPGQKVDLKDPFNQPLRYMGLVYNNMNSRQISIMERMRPFQYLYLIIFHNMKKLIATDQGNIFPMDSSLLDDSMTLEQRLYYLNTLKLYIYNGLEGADQPGASQRPGALGNVINWSNAANIVNYLEILQYIDEQIGEVAGVPRAREGQTQTYDAVTNAQQNIIQASIITEILFDAHTKYWEKVLDRLINLSINLYNINPSSYSYLNDSNKFESVRVKKGEFDNCDFNVFVVDSPQENEIFRQLQALAQPLLQNDKARFSHIIKLIKQKYSIEELTRDIERFEAEMDQIHQQQFQAEQDANKEAAQRADALERAKLDNDIRLKQMDIEGRIRVAEIQSFLGQKDQDINDDGVPDQLEIEKLKNERDQLQLKRDEMNMEKEERMKDRAHEKELAEKEIEGKIRIEKAKPKPKGPSK